MEEERDTIVNLYLQAQKFVLATEKNAPKVVVLVPQSFAYGMTLKQCLFLFRHEWKRLAVWTSGRLRLSVVCGTCTNWRMHESVRICLVPSPFRELGQSQSRLYPYLRCMYYVSLLLRGSSRNLHSERNAIKVLFSCLQNSKIYKISCHIKSLNACAKY